MAQFERRATLDAPVGEKLLSWLLLAVAGSIAVAGWVYFFDGEIPYADRVVQVLGLADRPGLGASSTKTSAGEIGATGTTVQTAADATTAGDAVSATATQAALAPHCAPGQAPTFVLGFAELDRRLGGVMGTPLECEHANPENGDALQRTTTGLAYYRKQSNTAMFTDGWRHWALTAKGLIYWEGESADPPGSPSSAIAP
jgi:hypothetical protein